MTNAVVSIKDKELIEADRHDWPAEVQALRSDKEREFVMRFIDTNNGAAAARHAGYGNPDGSSSPETMARIAYRLLHTDRIIEAIRALLKRDIRTLGPAAHKAMKQILETPYHKDQARVAIAIADRLDPPVQKIEGEFKHTHTLDHEAEALNQLRSLKALGVAREKLAEVFGQFGLERLEAKLEPEPIDVEFSEVGRDPDAEILGE